MELSDRIQQYLAGPDLLRKAVAGMTAEQLRARPVAGKWNTLEVVCHLADFEPIYADRMKRVIALDNPSFPGADHELFLQRLAYSERNIDEELAVIAATRRAMARILRTLRPEDLQRSGVHSEYGPKTLDQLLTTITNHIPHHAQFIAEKRKALGV